MIYLKCCKLPFNSYFFVELHGRPFSKRKKWGQCDGSVVSTKTDNQGSIARTHVAEENQPLQAILLHPHRGHPCICACLCIEIGVIKLFKETNDSTLFLGVIDVKWINVPRILKLNSCEYALTFRFFS